VIGLAKRLFVGIKISKALQNELDNPAPGTLRYFEANGPSDSLEIINVGDHRIIGRYIKDGFLAAELGEVSRNVGNMIKSITHGRRIEENDIQVFSS
jgi:hypothetical protein